MREVDNIKEKVLQSDYSDSKEFSSESDINNKTTDMEKNEFKEPVPSGVGHSDIVKLSLIIPVLQEEKILEETLLHYTKEMCNKFGIEIIVSDGGSTDKTLDIANKFTDKIIKCDKNQQYPQSTSSGVGYITRNKYQTISEGRNNGAEKASGDVFVFMNADTYPDNVEDFFTFILDWTEGKTRYNDCIALTCWVTVSPAEMLFKDRIFYAIHNRYIKFLNIIGMGMGRGECQIIKKDFFRRVGGYNNKLAAGEDFDLFRRLAKIGKIGFVKDLKVFESPRRFRKFGYMKVIMSWIYNSLSVIFRGRSISKKWEPVR
jgi:glycosyltransferase involved in cell wall biosynthesis